MIIPSESRALSNQEIAKKILSLSVLLHFVIPQKKTV